VAAAAAAAGGDSIALDAVPSTSASGESGSSGSNSSGDGNGNSPSAKLPLKNLRSSSFAVLPGSDASGAGGGGGSDGDAGGGGHGGGGVDVAPRAESGSGGSGGGGDDGSGGAQSSRVRSLLSQLPIAHNMFLPTARRISQFSEGRVPKPDDRVVYVCGSFDLFNSGHIAALAEARKMGTFLLVGIHDDVTVNRIRGHGLPILNLYERTLSLLSCRHVDEVIIGAPFVVTEELIHTMNIAVVAKGTVSDMTNADGHRAAQLDFERADVGAVVQSEYAAPSRLGILREFASPSPLTALSIVTRIIEARDAYKRRHDKTSVAEANYLANKASVAYVEEA
jgi:ethanolamine-phosphate cytidylyltransferase